MAYQPNDMEIAEAYGDQAERERGDKELNLRGTITKLFTQGRDPMDKYHAHGENGEKLGEFFTYGGAEQAINEYAESCDREPIPSTYVGDEKPFVTETG